MKRFEGRRGSFLGGWQASPPMGRHCHPPAECVHTIRDSIEKSNAYLLLATSAFFLSRLREWLGRNCKRNRLFPFAASRSLRYFPSVTPCPCYFSLPSRPRKVTGRGGVHRSRLTPVRLILRSPTRMKSFRCHVMYTRSIVSIAPQIYLAPRLIDLRDIAFFISHKTSRNTAASAADINNAYRRRVTKTLNRVRGARNRPWQLRSWELVVTYHPLAEISS